MTCSYCDRPDPAHVVVDEDGSESICTLCLIRHVGERDGTGTGFALVVSRQPIGETA